MDYIYKSELFKELDFWIIKILVMTFLASIFNYIIFFINKKIRKSTSIDEHYFVKTAIDAVYQPLITYIWWTYILYVLRQLPFSGNELFDTLSLYTRKMDLGKNIFLFWWAWFKFTERIEELLLGGHLKDYVRDKTKIQIISKLVRVVSVIVLTLSIFPVFSIPVSGIVAFAGSSAFVISFASKDLFANYVGGLMIHFDGHFRVGDWIITNVGGKHIEGAIEFIGWRSTLIRTPERRALFLPNYNFLSSVIENVTKSSNLRIYDTLEIRVEDIDKVSTITKNIYKTINSHPEIDLNQRNICFLEKVSNNVLTIRILAYTKTIDRFEFREVTQRVLEECCRVVLEAGATMSVPTRFVS